MKSPVSRTFFKTAISGLLAAAIVAPQPLFAQKSSEQLQPAKLEAIVFNLPSDSVRFDDIRSPDDVGGVIKVPINVQPNPDDNEELTIHLGNEVLTGKLEEKNDRAPSDEGSGFASRLMGLFRKKDSSQANAKVMIGEVEVPMAPRDPEALEQFSRMSLQEQQTFVTAKFKAISAIIKALQKLKFTTEEIVTIVTEIASHFDQSRRIVMNAVAKSKGVDVAAYGGIAAAGVFRKKLDQYAWGKELNKIGDRFGTGMGGIHVLTLADNKKSFIHIPSSLSKLDNVTTFVDPFGVTVYFTMGWYTEVDPQTGRIEPQKVSTQVIGPVLLTLGDNVFKISISTPLSASVFSFLWTIPPVGMAASLGTIYNTEGELVTGLSFDMAKTTENVAVRAVKAAVNSSRGLLTSLRGGGRCEAFFASH